MPSKSHKSDFAILTSLGVLVGICLAAIYTWGALRVDAGKPGVRTTHSTNVDGTMAASLLFERFDLAVPPLEHPLLTDTLTDVDVLWIVDPLIPLNAAEVSAIEDWVEAGGVLVSTGIAGRLFDGPQDEDRDLYGACVSCRTYAGKSSQFNRPADTIPASARQFPLAHGIAQLGWMTNRTLPVEKDKAFRPLLQDSTGVRIAGRRFGQGTAILLADSSFLANGLIGVQDNAVLATNLVHYALSQANGPDMAYDEYHLGYGTYQSGMEVLSQLMFTTSPGWAVASLTVAGLLFLLYKGRRFGTRREPGRPRRRSKLEFVQAVGASFRAAGAHRLVWQLLYADWKRQAARELGLPVAAPPGDVFFALARRANKPAGRYDGVMQACERAARQTRLSAREVTGLVGRLAELEQETRNANRGRDQNS